MLDHTDGFERDDIDGRAKRQLGGGEKPAGDPFERSLLQVEHIGVDAEIEQQGERPAQHHAHAEIGQAQHHQQKRQQSNAMTHADGNAALAE